MNLLLSLFIFQFNLLCLGHPDKLTNPVPGNKDPLFNERFVFPMVTNDQQLRLLLRSRLQVTVVDMNGEEAEDAGEGLIGKYCTCCVVQYCTVLYCTYGLVT